MELKKTNFLSLHSGVSHIIRSDFSPNTRNEIRPSSYYGAVYSKRKQNVQLDFGRQLNKKLYWLTQFDYNSHVGNFECLCLGCDKISVFTEAKIHQIGIATGVRWMLFDKEKFDFAVDGLTGVKLDINQNASIPWFVSVSPAFIYSPHPRHALSLIAGFSSHLVGYTEHSIINTLGYQFSF